MNSKVHPQIVSPVENITEYTHWSCVFVSWFWRFYDHLFIVTFYNFGWFSTCYLASWLSSRFNLIGNLESVKISGLFLLCLIEITISIGWAFLIFKIFSENNGKISNYWLGLRKYYWKAIGLSLLSGLVLFIGLYNLRFYSSVFPAHQVLSLIMIGIVGWIITIWLLSAMFYWPLLFFQNPPFFKIIIKSSLMVLANGIPSLGFLIFFGIAASFFTLVPLMWFFLGIGFLFSFQCVILEKYLLRYKITYENKPLGVFLDILRNEQSRSWREILKPWENK